MKRILLLTLLLVLLSPVTARASIENNCWDLIRQVVYRPIYTAEVRANLHQQPQAGDVAYFYYYKQGLPHYAYVLDVTPWGILILESNMHHLYKGGIGARLINTDPHLVGYFTP